MSAEIVFDNDVGRGGGVDRGDSDDTTTTHPRCLKKSNNYEHLFGDLETFLFRPSYSENLNVPNTNCRLRFGFWSM